MLLCINPHGEVCPGRWSRALGLRADLWSRAGQEARCACMVKCMVKGARTEVQGPPLFSGVWQHSVASLCPELEGSLLSDHSRSTLCWPSPIETPKLNAMSSHIRQNTAHKAIGAFTGLFLRRTCSRSLCRAHAQASVWTAAGSRGSSSSPARCRCRRRTAPSCSFDRNPRRHDWARTDRQVHHGRSAMDAGSS